MATTTAVTLYTSTTNASSYTTASFTPAANDLLVVMAIATASFLQSPTLTESQGETTFTLVYDGVDNISLKTGDRMYLFVANSLLASATARTLNFDCTGDAASGCILATYRVSGMSKTGAAAIRQKTFTHWTDTSTITTTFASTCLTGNPTITYWGDSTSTTPNKTAPTNWTRNHNGGYSNPSTGCCSCTRDSGFTGDTITWGSAGAIDSSVISIELDAGAASAPLSFGFVIG